MTEVRLYYIYAAHVTNDALRMSGPHFYCLSVGHNEKEAIERINRNYGDSLNGPFTTKEVKIEGFEIRVAPRNLEQSVSVK